jgi:hypothetical protein
LKDYCHTQPADVPEARLAPLAGVAVWQGKFSATISTYLLSAVVAAI